MVGHGSHHTKVQTRQDVMVESRIVQIVSKLKTLVQPNDPLIELVRESYLLGYRDGKQDGGLEG
jgi:hypothetical protein